MDDRTNDVPREDAEREDAQTEDREDAWALADADVRWRDHASVASMSAWCEWRSAESGGDVLCLKDTHKGTYYRNRLVAPNRFVYQVPARPKMHEVRVVERLRLEAAASRKSLRVHVYSTPHGRNRHLGAFAVTAYVAQTDKWYAHAVELTRLRRQPDDPLGVVVKRRRGDGLVRSSSEGRHLELVRTLVPSGWRVAHEPVSVSLLDAPMVVDGQLSPWAGDEYVVDFVACSADGTRRVCIESKCDAVDGHDPAAWQKCRFLCDHSLTRVVLMHGHGADLRWLDFGAPGNADPPVETADPPACLEACDRANTP
jgi:hypothetical protein